MSGRITSKMKSKRNVKSLNDSDEKKDDDDLDTSILSKPLTTNVSGLTKALKVLNSATEEVRNYLTYECELLYECRICRNIFRSISNFILHKRNYCQDKYNCLIHLKCSNNIDDDSTNVSETSTFEKKENDDDKTDKTTNKKSLNSLIENLAQQKQFGFERDDFSINEFYKGYEHGISTNNDTQLNLDHINGSDCSVYQSVTKNPEENKITELQLEVAEIHNMLEGQSVVLGPDGKILDINKGNNTRTGLLAVESCISSSERTCEECKIKFATRKTYLSHMKYKHAEFRLVYPCPDCSEVYATPWSVYRHLYNIHRKTLSQVRKLRDAVQSRAYTQMQPSSKKSPQTSSQDITEQERIDDENLEWMANFETDNDIQMCGGCGKRFERRAALNSHSQTCQKRIAARNTIVINKNKRIAAAEEKSGDKKSAKLMKIDATPEVKNNDKRKSSVILRKRKTGSIQIRYDYIKSNNNEKNIATDKLTEVPSDKNTDADNRNKGNTVYLENTIKDDDLSENLEQNPETTSNTDEIYSILGIPSDLKPTEECTDKKDVIETEVLSIHSSNNTTPNKDSEDPLQLLDDTDSEIAEILGSSSDSGKNDYVLVSNTFENDIENNDKDKFNILDPNIINENTLQFINLLNSSETNKNKISLDDKMFSYVDIKKLHCKPCNIKFNNISKLRCHMSLHFNWMRYCCDICSLKAYEKSTIYDHIERDHNVSEPDKIEAVIFQIPDWETIELCSKEFIYLDNNLNADNTDGSMLISTDEQIEPAADNFVFIKTEKLKTEDGESGLQQKTSKSRGRPKKHHLKPNKVKKKSDEDKNNEDKKCSDDQFSERESGEMKNMQDNDLRKMVFEVIFGQNNENMADSDNLSNKSDYENSKDDISDQTEISNITSRPVRNRVKPVDKDFIYDLNEFMDGSKSVSQNSSGYLEEYSGSNKTKYLMKKTGKRPGPKCKTMSIVSIKDNRSTNLTLQKNGSKKYKVVELRDEPDKDISTNKKIRMFQSSSSKKFDKTVDSDSDVCIIEDD